MTKFHLGLFLLTLLPLPLAAQDLPVQSEYGQPPDAPAAQQDRRIRILTWNVLGPTSSQRLLATLGFHTDSDRHTERLIEQIHRQAPDLVTLQEVGPTFLMILSDNRHFGPYHIAAQGLDPPAGGLVTLSRLPVTDTRYQRLPGELGRGVLYTTVAVGEHHLVIANVHLESPLDAGDIRRSQMQVVDDRMPWADWQVWAGDFNFGDQGPEQIQPLLSRWTDVWQQLKPEQAGYSYDLGRNPLAGNNAYSGELSRRLDRILVSTTLQPLDIRLVGTGNAPASDHYGIVADLLIQRPAGSLQ